MNTQEEKPMKLISMVDFVISQWSIELTVAQRNAIKNYADFLSQPLTLGMFVPVDENGNVLIEPVNDFRGHKDYSKRLTVFEKARYKVLFEGFEFDNKEKLEDFSILKNGSVSLNYDFKYKTFELNRYYFENVEDLIDCNVFLTKTAKNQIFQ